MKRWKWPALSLALLLLLGGCGKKKSEGTATENPAESGSAQIELSTAPARAQDADDPADAAWANSLTTGLPPRERLLRETKFAGDGSVMGWTDYAYDEQGYLFSETPYNAEGGRNVGEYTYRYTYEYVNGWLTAKNAYNYNDVLVYRYKYDSAGNEIKWLLYSLETGELRLWYEDTFDDHGSITSHVMYTPGEAPGLMNHREYDYDEQDNPVECRYLSESGSVIGRYGYKYSYDAQGRAVEYVQEDLGGNELVEWYRYQYDENGRMSVKTQIDAGGRENIREEYEYDGQGRLSCTRIYTAAGELAVILENIWQ